MDNSGESKTSWKWTKLARCFLGVAPLKEVKWRIFQQFFVSNLTFRSPEFKLCYLTSQKRGLCCSQNPQFYPANERLMYLKIFYHFLGGKSYLTASPPLAVRLGPPSPPSADPLPLSPVFVLRDLIHPCLQETVRPRRVPERPRRLEAVLSRVEAGQGGRRRLPGEALQWGPPGIAREDGRGQPV